MKWGVGNDGYDFAGKTTICFQCSVSQRIDVLENPVATMPWFRSFTPNILPEMPQNVIAVLAINSMTLGDEFKVHNGLGCAPDLMCFLVLETAGSFTTKSVFLISGL